MNVRNRIKTSFITLGLSSLICFNAQADLEDKLIGSWNCSAEMSENGGSFKFKTTDIYKKDNTVTSNGHMYIRFAPNMPEIHYTLASKGSWSIEGSRLKATEDKIDVKNVSHPEFDKIINLSSMFPENITETMEILELTDARLKVRTESDGSEFLCTR